MQDLSTLNTESLHSIVDTTLSLCITRDRIGQFIIFDPNRAVNDNNYTKHQQQYQEETRTLLLIVLGFVDWRNRDITSSSIPIQRRILSVPNKGVNFIASICLSLSTNCTFYKTFFYLRCCISKIVTFLDFFFHRHRRCYQI